MNYHIDFQYLPKGAPRPIDNGEILPIEITDEAGSGLIPSVGDYVQIDNSLTGCADRASFSGKVRSRLFLYFGSEQENTCAVNIVVEDTDDDFGMLIKE